jgi:hypothetical protein
MITVAAICACVLECGGSSRRISFRGQFGSIQNIEKPLQPNPTCPAFAHER